MKDLNPRQTYRATETQGINACWTKMTDWRHLNVCPKCGSKITCAMITNPPLYRCECITDEEWQMNLKNA